ncbi:peroxisomal acyl-coenzyme A oxidase 3-like isoform X2 [Photinus pyralis]|uniref:peroxisomal acyl-coenzyme A oxidase 3-like isoform X2 n=1 Tax=Photinus pyralis TaxID=7054 RepID=UPI0012677203|nr:peroxisomal acyl-coenzyme A oxidase 3-like isoform X2 [Photinus pyralis]
MCALHDFPKSPLDIYREKASFEWKKLKTILYSTESINFQIKYYDELRKHPTLLHKSPLTPSQGNQKRIATMEMFDCIDIKKNWNCECAPLEKDFKVTVNNVPSLKSGFVFNLFSDAISTMGTERHQELAKRSLRGEIIGSLALTEIGHGSDANCIQTRAVYDKHAREFVLNTPGFLAAKCWMLNVGYVATHIILYAQLVTPDQVNHGMHTFVVPIRSPRTLLPYPGVSVTDLGEKIGLKALDNGFIIFNDYRIPKDSLLNRLADVSDDGIYSSRISDPIARFGIILSTLSSGRVKTLGVSTALVRHAVAIAIRYTAVSSKKQAPMLKNPAHQVRLFPCLAIAYMGHIIHTELETIQKRLLNSDQTSVQLGTELHAVTSAGKPVYTWLARGCIRKCLEVSADNAYLTVSGLEEILLISDPAYTYEGDNNVLIQQTSKWLLKLWTSALQGKTIQFPLSTANFLSETDEILKQRFSVTCFANFTAIRSVHCYAHYTTFISDIVAYYRWLTCYLLKLTYDKQVSLRKQESSTFFVNNSNQVYFSKSLATVYFLHYVVQTANEVISCVTDYSSKEVLLKLLSLFGVWNLRKYAHYFYQGNYTNDPNFGHYIEEAILALCRSLTDDAISLIDAILPDDCLLNSVLGHSDGT